MLTIAIIYGLTYYRKGHLIYKRLNFFLRSYSCLIWKLCQVSCFQPARVKIIIQNRRADFLMLKCFIRPSHRTQRCLISALLLHCKITNSVSKHWSFEIFAMITMNNPLFEDETPCIECLFSCLTDMRRPNAPPDAMPALRCTPRVAEV
jgi:hypothetical protein